MYLLLKQLEPKDTGYLNTIEGQKNWLSKVYAYRPVVERIFAVFAAFECRDISDRTKTVKDMLDVTVGQGCLNAIHVSRYLLILLNKTIGISQNISMYQAFYQNIEEIQQKVTL